MHSAPNFRCVDRHLLPRGVRRQWILFCTECANTVRTSLNEKIWLISNINENEKYKIKSRPCSRHIALISINFPWRAVLIITAFRCAVLGEVKDSGTWHLLRDVPCLSTEQVALIFSGSCRRFSESERSDQESACPSADKLSPETVQTHKLISPQIKYSFVSYAIIGWLINCLLNIFYSFPYMVFIVFYSRWLMKINHGLSDFFSKIIFVSY